MSLRFRNELRMELRMTSCHVELTGRGWRRRPVAVADGTGSGATALNAALQALRLTEIDSLPSVARLTVADEYVFYALLDDPPDDDQAREQARRCFADALERSDLHVQVMPLGRGRRWLAAAVADADLQAWSSTLQQVGVTLTHLHAALIEDLRSLAALIPEDDAVIALLREEGVSLVRLRDGLPIALAWERFDADLPQSLDQRLRAFIRDAASQEGVDDPCVIYLLPESRALCRYVWDGRDLPGLLPLPASRSGTRWMSRPMIEPSPRSRPAGPGAQQDHVATAPSVTATVEEQRRSESMPLPDVVEWHEPRPDSTQP